MRLANNSRKARRFMKDPMGDVTEFYSAREGGSNRTVGNRLFGGDKGIAVFFGT